MSEVIVVIGTRPEIMKTASIIDNLSRRVNLTLVWSGQHYDRNMYGVFFEQFKLSDPDYDLKVGSGTQASQTSQIMVRLEKIATESKPKIILAQGDTNTGAAVALTSSKLRIPFAHVESGMRSFDMTMPEELNRLVADKLAEFLFAPTETAVLNLLFEGIASSKVYLSGDTLIDAILKFSGKLDRKMLDALSVKPKSYGLVTIHRAENTENQDNLKNIIEGLKEVAKNIPLVFPIHPRTRRFMATHGLSLDKGNIMATDPLGYLEFLSLLKESLLVITDSGGVQEEALTLRVPCVTTRNNTEWAETLKAGGNILAGPTTDKIIETARFVLENNEDIRWKLERSPNPLGDGLAGERISKVIINKLNESKSGRLVTSIDFRESGYPRYVLLSGDSFENLSVSQINEKWEVATTLMYDQFGEPKPTYLDTIIRKGWSIVLWGPAKQIDTVVQFSKDLKRYEKSSRSPRKTAKHKKQYAE